jgi:hypothetical protein
MSTDHVKEIGTCETWDEFINKLFCEANNLQAICRSCHKTKTAKEQKIRNAIRKQGKRESLS